ncbi:MAG TPA: RHS repeat-associated core domain-containing protein [Armatimonadota bacterium]|jgi:RHS repeat-associated protein
MVPYASGAVGASRLPEISACLRRQAANGRGVWVSRVRDSFGHQGQADYYRDSETGLYLCTFRYYEPREGRWLNEDPIGYGGGVNLYGYVGGDPVGGTDPMGEHTIVFGGDRLKVFDDSGHLLKTVPAFSGIPGMTADDSTGFHGPTPEGDYWVDPATVQWHTPWYNPLSWVPGNPRYSTPLSSWGNFRVPITPSAGTDTHDRNGMFIHGGSEVGSHGCIDVGPNDRSVIEGIIEKHKGRLKLRVDYSGWDGRVPGGSWDLFLFRQQSLEPRR